MITGENSNLCLEGCRLPATDSYLSLQNINSYRLEGTEKINIKTTKICSYCSKEKNISEFYGEIRNGKHYLRPECKQCKKEHISKLRCQPSKEQLELMYITEKLSIFTIAIKLNYSKSAIRYMLAKHGITRRNASEAWKGARRQGMLQYGIGHTHDTQGYILVLNREHPNANNRGYVRKHRLVMEKIIRRYLLSNEVVHHINGVKNDNRPENLILLTTTTHSASIVTKAMQKRIQDLENMVKI